MGDYEGCFLLVAFFLLSAKEDFYLFIQYSHTTYSGLMIVKIYVEVLDFGSDGQDHLVFSFWSGFGVFVWSSCVVLSFDWVDLWTGAGEGGGAFGRSRFVPRSRGGCF